MEESYRSDQRITLSDQPVTLTHDDVLNIKSAWDYLTDPKGECFGGAATAVGSIVANDPVSYIQRFQNLSRHWQEQKLVGLDEKDALSLRAFFDTMALHQDPCKYADLFEEKSRPTRQDLVLTSSLVSPLALTEQKRLGGEVSLLDQVMSWSEGYDQSILKNDLQILRQEFKKNNIQNPVAFLLRSSNHAMTIGWFPEGDYWWFVDFNQLFLLNSKIKEESDLANYSVRGFSKNGISVFSTEVYAIEFEAKRVRQCIQSCQQQRDWQASHALDEKRINRQDSDGATMLYIAAKSGHIEVVKTLIKAGANIDQATNGGATAFYVAAEKGYIEVVELLIDAGANVDEAKNDGATALYIAAEQGRIEVVKFLIDAGANVGKATNNGSTALYIAAQKGHIEVVKFLIDAGADIDQTRKDGATALYIAAEQGRIEVVKFLIKAGAMIDQAASTGATALCIAAQEGHIEVVRALIDAGANIGQATSTEATALHIAAYERHIEVVEALIAAGANINQAKSNGVTAFYIAARNGYKDICEILLKHQAQQAVPITVSVDILSEAAKEKGRQSELEQLLKNKGIKKDEFNGFTALHAAAFFGHVEIVDLLLLDKADPFAVTEMNISAFEFAKAMGNQSIMEKIGKVELMKKLENYIYTEEKSGNKDSWYGRFLGFSQADKLSAARKVLSYIKGTAPLSLWSEEYRALSSSDLYKITHAHWDLISSKIKLVSHSAEEPVYPLRF